MPSQKFSYSATTAASRDTVWAALQEPKSWEGVSGVDRVKDPIIDGDGALRGFSFDSQVAGKAYVGTARPAARNEGRLMAWDIETSDVAGTVTVELEDNGTPEGAGTVVAVSLLVAATGTLSSVFFPLITSTIEKGFPETVENFAASFD